MTEHLRNVRQEHIHTQALLDAKVKEINTESHMQKLSQRQLGRLMSELRKVKQETETTQDETTSLQNEVFAASEKVERFKLQMNWNREELLEWAAAVKQKVRDQVIISTLYQ